MAPRSGPYRPSAPSVCELSAGGVIRDPSGSRVLLLHEREEDRWTLPKGHVEPGESLEAAARREIREETGLDPVVLRRELLEVHYRFFQPSHGRNVIKTVVYFEVASTSEEVRTEPIFDTFAWVSPDDALARVSKPTDREALRALASPHPP